MASCSSLLSEKKFECSICLQVFTEPVSTPCGHNFCKVCISNYWDTTNVYQCPLCKNEFSRRPELHVNTEFRDLVENFKRLKVRDEEESTARPREVTCDVCRGEGTGEKALKALKSCLVCQTSYCKTHLQSHLKVAALKKHKLIKPLENLAVRMCQKHSKVLELFCRKDQTCVCPKCMKKDHKSHDAVRLEEECRQRKPILRKMKADIDQMVKTRSMKVQQIEHSVETSKIYAKREISDSVELRNALVSSIEKSQTSGEQVINEQQKTAENQALRFIKELKQEITELKRRSSELEQLSHSDDHLHLLQSFQSLTIPPHTKDWSQVSTKDFSQVSVHSGVGTLMRDVSQLEHTLIQAITRLCEAELKRIQQYAVDVTLDPDTAHPKLILSEDGRQVRHRDTQKNLPDNPKRFDQFPGVLGKRSFSSGKFYYEVQVDGKTDWDLGVARESINRKGEITLNPDNGYWTIRRRNGHEYVAAAIPHVPLSLREKPKKVGIFVDYEECRVSFYNVMNTSHICSYTGCTFTEKLHPFLSPSLNDGGKVPLIITSVTHTA